MNQHQLEDVAIKARSKEFHIVKMAEEFGEALEVIMKLLTKSGTSQPTMTKIAEELGDVIVRGRILARVLDIEKKVEDRVKEKTDSLLKAYIRDLETQGGI